MTAANKLDTCLKEGTSETNCAERTEKEFDKPLHSKKKRFSAQPSALSHRSWIKINGQRKQCEHLTDLIKSCTPGPFEAVQFYSHSQVTPCQSNIINTKDNFCYSSF